MFIRLEIDSNPRCPKSIQERGKLPFLSTLPLMIVHRVMVQRMVSNLSLRSRHGLILVYD